MFQKVTFIKNFIKHSENKAVIKANSYLMWVQPISRLLLIDIIYFWSQIYIYLRVPLGVCRATFKAYFIFCCNILKGNQVQLIPGIWQVKTDRSLQIISGLTEVSDPTKTLRHSDYCLEDPRGSRSGCGIYPKLRKKFGFKGGFFTTCGSAGGFA